MYVTAINMHRAKSIICKLFDNVVKEMPITELQLNSRKDCKRNRRHTLNL